jgi:predicted Rossmann fold flavoprotein
MPEQGQKMPELKQMACRVAVIGGGAAGLMAAISAAAVMDELRPESTGESFLSENGGKPVPVIILEKQDRVGRKLLATGNGQCNLSNLLSSPKYYHGYNSHFTEDALHQLDVFGTQDLFSRLGLKLLIEPDGRIYPYSRQASAVLDILRLAVRRFGIRTMTSFPVDRIDPVRLSNHENAFDIHSSDGQTVRSSRIVIASGGLAAPSLGADGSGYQLMSRFGHRVSDCFPALVPIRTETEFVHGLAGIKFDGTAGG